ncbi:MAG: glycosyltransferase [Patescibacteria group bacterium]|jgi:glycosyltransferase involved in cell wall biosynthesis
MKIASIVCAFPPYAGGMGNSADRISQILRTEHEVIDFTPYNTKPWLKYGHGSVLGSLLWRLKSFDYIYLHYPYFGTAEIVWLFKIFHKKPKLIIHYHMDVVGLNPLAKILSLPSRFIRASLLKQAELIVTASLDYVKHSQIKDGYGAHPEKFREIPFSVDLDKFRPSGMKTPANNILLAKAKEIVNFVSAKFIKKDRFDLLFVGALDTAHYFKGVDVLLRAAAGLGGLNFELTIAGEGDKRPEYEALALRLNLNKKVRFVGKLSETELVRAYQKADLLILPSINGNEAFGIVLIEALACGAPVMASNLPGVRQVFNDGEEGLLIEPGSVFDLEQKLRLFMSDKLRPGEMAEKARALAEKKYGDNLMKTKFRELFK